MIDEIILSPQKSEEITRLTSPLTNLPVEFTPDQTTPSRLAEYITGIPGEHLPELVTRMALDQKKLMEEYNLPPFSLRFHNPNEYLSSLQIIARQHGIPIINLKENLDDVPKDARRKLKELTQTLHYPFYDDEYGTSTVYLPDPNSTKDEDLQKFVHELIHAIDHRHNPQLQIELREYRAYLAELGDVQAVSNSLGEKFVNYFFGPLKVAGSSRYFYRSKGIPFPSWNK